jgi:hypothetical protein
MLASNQETMEECHTQSIESKQWDPLLENKQQQQQQQKGLKNAANHDTVEALVFHQCFFQCLLKLRQIDEILESKDAHDVAAHVRFTE